MRYTSKIVIATAAITGLILPILHNYYHGNLVDELAISMAIAVASASILATYLLIGESRKNPTSKPLFEHEYDAK
ncbi:hypothetical protein HY546_00630 [archaeon]|nr:hypothetical protein [archaeon]